MNGFSNSLFCTLELGLVKFYLKQAVEKSSLKSLKDVDKNESENLVFEFVVPAVEQSIKDCSNVGSWRDEKYYVLMKIHGWFFTSWMITRRGLTTDECLPIGTVFYSEILRTCHFQEYVIQCLSNVDKTTAEVLIQDLASNVGEEKTTLLLLQLVEQCLLQLGCLREKIGRISTTRLSHILIQIARNVEQQWIQVDILSKLNESLDTLLQQLRQRPSNPSGNSFTEKVNIIEFTERLSDIMGEVQETKTTAECAPKLDSSHMSEKKSSQALVQAAVCLVSCINHVVTVQWKSLFDWQLNHVGCKVLAGVEDANCHGLLLSLYTTCKSLQTLTILKDLALCKELQCMRDILEPYWQQHGTAEEIKSCSEDIASGAHDGNGSFGEIEMINGTVEEKLQHALYRVNENLLGDDLCFEWLLLKEELYLDERWLTCVETHAEKFVSIKIMKMLLDVLSVFQEFDILPGGIHVNIYISLKKVILNLLTHLTLPEQREVILYSFDLTHSHGPAFFLYPDVETSECFLRSILTGTMNKLVKSQSFSKDVMDGIIQGCLGSPYLTLKELLTEASKRDGYEKVVCQLLQVIPWFVGLGREDEDSLLIRVLKHQLWSSHDFSKKQAGQFLKLIEALMQSYVHPDFGTKESALIAASDVTQHVVMAVLADQAAPPPLALHVLMKCLSCGLISTNQKAQCSFDPDHLLQLLFVVLEIHQDIEQFWIDWQAGSESLDDGTDSEDFDDITLLEAWDEMDVTIKIIEEHLVPFLIEDISREPHHYHSYVQTMQDCLNKLDWTSSLLITPLLQTEVFKQCTIQSPSSLTNLMSSHFKVRPVEGKESTSFWKIYFQSCANSIEVFGMLLSKLQESHPRDTQVGQNDSNEIIHNAANLLPFTTQTQWQRVVDIMVEMMKCKYLTLKDEWKSDLMVLPNISNVVDNVVIKTSELLVLILRDLSKTERNASYVWIAALKNYVSNFKKLSLQIATEDKFEITCHLSAHLAYTAFKIVPGSLEERITIILLDLFNQGLLCVSSRDNDKSVSYLEGIINMIPRNELRLAMSNTMDKMLSKNMI